MPTLDEMLRKEQDLFGQERQEQQEQSSVFLPARHEEVAEAKKEEPTTAEVETPVKEPAPAPHIVAEVAQQGEVPQETLVRLFEHYADKDEDDEIADVPVVAKSDLRQLMRDPRPGEIDAGEVIRDGIEADFVADSAIAGADLDTHHRGDADWDGWQERRRKGQAESRGPGEKPPELEAVDQAAPAATTTVKEKPSQT